MQVLLEDKKILIEALYGPNQDTPEFYTDQVFKKLQEWDPDYAIFAGDYSVALDQEKDTKNYLHINNPSIWWMCGESNTPMKEHSHGENLMEKNKAD